MHTMVKMVFGSHLYGLDTENSDKDYRGIFVPTAKEIILGSMKEHYDQSTSGQGIKNTKDDIDVNMFSLKRFINLACKGDIGAIDMVHAPSNMLIESSKEWEYIRTHRDKFYHVGMWGLSGYLKKQVAKSEKYFSNWKDLSHALRVGYQLLEIYQTGDLQFPLARRSSILACKLGERTFDNVREELKDLYERVKLAREEAKKNGMPEEPDVDFWKDLLEYIHLTVVLEHYTRG